MFNNLYGRPVMVNNYVRNIESEGSFHGIFQEHNCYENQNGQWVENLTAYYFVEVQKDDGSWEIIRLLPENTTVTFLDRNKDGTIDDKPAMEVCLN